LVLGQQRYPRMAAVAEVQAGATTPEAEAALVCLALAETALYRLLVLLGRITALPEPQRQMQLTARPFKVEALAGVVVFMVSGGLMLVLLLSAAAAVAAALGMTVQKPRRTPGLAGHLVTFRAARLVSAAER
jgi:hypothetical protein